MAFHSVALATVACLITLASASGPPFFTKKAAYARWMAENEIAGVLSTTSVHLKGAPFGNVQSFAGAADGHLYFYTSSLDTSMQDVAANPKVSFALSLQEYGNYCTKKQYFSDAEDPRCARLTFMGSMRACTAAETPTANATLFAKHPEMKSWPPSHDFRFFTIDLSDLFFINMFGGATILKADDYYKATTTSTSKSLPPPAGFPALQPQVALGMPPWPHNETTRTARWLAHASNYGFLSSNSVQFDGVAFGNVQSVVDGPADNATGHLYFYTSDLDASMVDVAKDARVSFTMSEEFIWDGHNCSGSTIDPEDPTCTRLVMSGKFVEVGNTTAEYTFAHSALFTRHPGMKKWPNDHSWKIMTLDVEDIWEINYYGGATVIAPADYFAYSSA